MNRPLIRTMGVLMTLMALIGIEKTAAQSFEYPTYEDDTVRIVVRSQGAHPTIADFATAFLDHSKGMDFYDKVSDEWSRYLQKKPLRFSRPFVVDIKNGFMSYEMLGEESNDTTFIEMCYWNCADGKHQLVCFNVRLKMGDDYGWGEHVGYTFFLYDNKEQTMRNIWADDLDALYDGNGLSVFFLPRKGKNIRVLVSSEGDRWNEVLVWDGYKFTARGSNNGY